MRRSGSFCMPLSNPPLTNFLVLLAEKGCFYWINWILRTPLLRPGSNLSDLTSEISYLKYLIILALFFH